jgi:hypothetical protein
MPRGNPDRRAVPPGGLEKQTEKTRRLANWTDSKFGHPQPPFLSPPEVSYCGRNNSIHSKIQALPSTEAPSYFGELIGVVV